MTDQGTSGSTVVAGTTIKVTSNGPVNSTPNPIVSSADIATAPLTAQGVTITGTEGTALNPTPGGDVLVATFMDTGTVGATTAYAAMINWGDESAATADTRITSQGTANGIVFSVFGNHTYTAAGTYPVSVTITKTATGATAIASSQAVIASAPLTPGAPVTVNTNSGVLLTNTVLGSFTDVNPAAPVGDFSATIDWGDGTPTSLGTIAQPSGAGTPFDVEGTHAYAAAGSYALKILVHDTDGSTGTVTGTVNVTDRALIDATAYPVSAVAGQNTGTIVLANFTDPNSLDTGSGVSATVNWGDGTGTLPAAVTLIGAGGSMFEVTGNHTYTTPGTDTVSITITTLGGATTAPSPLTATATVADAPITASGTSITGTEGLSTGNVVIATFTDANPGATLADFTTGSGSIKVNWGDGSAVQTLPASALTSTGTPNGVVFTVTAAHTYAEADPYQVTVVITDTGGGTATANGGASIGDAAADGRCPGRPHSEYRRVAEQCGRRQLHRCQPRGSADRLHRHDQLGRRNADERGDDRAAGRRGNGVRGRGHACLREAGLVRDEHRGQ